MTDALLSWTRRLIDACSATPGVPRFAEQTRVFPRWEDKAAFLGREARRDALDPVVVQLGAWFRSTYVPRNQRAVAIHRWVRDTIHYRRDPLRGGARREQFASSRVVLLTGEDDCDGKARLFVALCLAAGLDARILPVVRGGAFVHVQGEVLLARGWTVAEVILRGVELGQGIEAAQRDALGRAITT